MRIIHIFFIIAVVVPGFLNAQTIEFTKKTGVDNPLNNADAGSGVSSISVDIDNDGDYDLFLGNSSGTIQYFKNISTEENPNVFEEQLNAANPLNGVDVGTNSIPTFVDIDNNGTLDCFIGSSNSIHYYKNIGTISTPNFVVQLTNANPLDGVTHSGDRSYLPTFVDIDNDSDFDVFIGFVDYDTEDSQGILYYKNIGNNSNPSFENQSGSDNPFQNFNELYPQPVFLDLDSDNDFDAFIGKGSGEFDYYENTTDAAQLSIDDVKINKVAMYPNPAILSVSFNVEEENLVRLFSLNGLEIFNGVVSKEKNIIDTSRIAAGIYIVVLDNGKRKITQKLVIKK